MNKFSAAPNIIYSWVKWIDPNTHMYIFKIIAECYTLFCITQKSKNKTSYIYSVVIIVLLFVVVVVFIYIFRPYELLLTKCILKEGWFLGRRCHSQMSKSSWILILSNFFFAKFMFQLLAKHPSSLAELTYFEGSGDRSFCLNLDILNKNFGIECIAGRKQTVERPQWSGGIWCVVWWIAGWTLTIDWTDRLTDWLTSSALGSHICAWEGQMGEIKLDFKDIL